MIGRIFGLFVGFGVLELFLLIWAGSQFGALPVFGVLIAAAILGIVLIRRFGLRSLGGLQSRMRDPGKPLPPLSSGLFGALAGFLLFVPGFLTDIAGLVLLIPAVQRKILSRFTIIETQQSGWTRRQGPLVIEGEAIEITEERPPPQEPRP